MSSNPPLPTSRARSVLIVAFCCMAAMGEGFDLQAPGVTLPVLAPLFKLATGEGRGFLAGFLSQKSLFISISTFGLMFGAIIGGRAADLIGRKWVAIGAVSLFALFSVFTAQATSTSMLLWARFLTGLGLGGALPGLIATVSEAVSPARRKTAMGCLYAGMPAGGALVSLFSYVLANPAHWRIIYYLGGLLPILAVPGLIFGVPSLSPTASRPGGNKPSIGFALFGEDRASRTIILWICFLFAMVTQYILLGWLPTLMISKGLPRPDTSIVQMSFNVFGAVGSVITGILTDRPGRAMTTALVFLAGIVSLGLLAGAPATLAVSVLAGSMVGFTISGAQAIVYALPAGAYPATMRGTGVGFSVAAGRIGAASGPLLAGAMLSAGSSASKVLVLLVPLMVVAGLAAWWINRAPPKTDAFATDSVLALEA